MSGEVVPPAAMPAQAAAATTPAPAGAGAAGAQLPQPVDGEASAAAGTGATDKPGATAGAVSGSAGSGPATAAQGAADAGQGPTARLAGQGDAAGPAAALTAVSALAAEDADVPVTALEPGTGTELTTASVRGGDLNGAVRTESLQTPNQTQSSHAANQVAAEIARNLKDGQTRFQMRFDPPELGRVDVKMKVSADGSVQAHLIVERPETLDMFLRDQRGLERALEAAGLNTGSGNLEFSLKQDGGGDFAQGESDREAGSSDGAGDGTSEIDPDGDDRVRLMLAEQRGGLDMKV
jgi:hypothetical protein